MSNTKIKYIVTGNSVIVYPPGQNSITILRGTPEYSQAREIIKNGQLERLLSLAPAQAIPQKSNNKFTVVGGQILIDGEAIPPALSKAMLRLLVEEQDITRLERFWDNLKLNPSEVSRERLFAFLEANQVAITQDGCFIAYKRVTDAQSTGAHLDLHSGTVKYRLGKPTKMPREQVDANNDHECSTGLHVAAFNYAANIFGSGRGVILEVKVHPANVVAVPPDYRGQKMRVCELLPLKIVTEPTVASAYDDPAEETAEPAVKTKWRPITLTTGVDGRLRIPGLAIRRLGLGVGATVHAYVPSKRSKAIVLSATASITSHFASTHVAQKDNSVRLSPEILNKITHFPAGQFKLAERQGVMEVRAT